MCEEERDEPDAEREAREKLIPGLIQHAEIRGDAQPHLETAEEPCDEDDAPRALQPLGALGDGGVEGLGQLVLDHLIRLADLAPSVLVVAHDRPAHGS